MKRTQQQTSNRSVQGAQTRSLIVSPQEENISYDEQAESELQDQHDPVLQPPLWLFILGAIEILWGAVTNVIQAFTSIVGIVGWQQSDTIATYGILPGAKHLLANNAEFGIVACVLGVGAQIGIQVTSQQISRKWKQKRVEEHESVRQAMVEIVSSADVGNILGGISFLICAVSDYLFITDLLPSGSLGSYFLMTFWGLILACSSTYVLIDGIQRVWSGVLAHRAWKLWQQVLTTHYQELAKQYH